MVVNPVLSGNSDKQNKNKKTKKPKCLDMFGADALFLIWGWVSL